MPCALGQVVYKDWQSGSHHYWIYAFVNGALSLGNHALRIPINAPYSWPSLLEIFPSFSISQFESHTDGNFKAELGCIYVPYHKTRDRAFVYSLSLYCTKL